MVLSSWVVRHLKALSANRGASAGETQHSWLEQQRFERGKNL